MELHDWAQNPRQFHELLQSDKVAIDVRDIPSMDRYLHKDNCPPHKAVSNVHKLPSLLILKETKGLSEKEVASLYSKEKR
jgi:hypothetical protein